MLFVGTGTNTGSKGIYSFQFDSSSGELKPLGLAAEAPSPSFLALSPDKQFLFAVNEIDTYQGAKTGAVSSYSLDKASGKLTLINTVASGGSGPCHVNTDRTGRVLLVANYTGGSAASFQIDWNGHLSNAVSEFHYESTGAGPGQDKDRQATAHAHHATTSPDNRFAYINDLGLDCIHIYRLDAATAKLTPNNPAEWVAAPGSGPRVLRFHPNGQWAYCVNELSSTIDLLAWHPRTGELTLVQKTDLIPKDFKGISSCGRDHLRQERPVRLRLQPRRRLPGRIRHRPVKRKTLFPAPHPLRRQDPSPHRPRPHGEVDSGREPGLQPHRCLPPRSRKPGN